MEKQILSSPPDGHQIEQLHVLEEASFVLGRKQLDWSTDSCEPVTSHHIHPFHSSSSWNENDAKV